MSATPHRIDFTGCRLNEWDEPEPTFHCDAPEGAPCRTWCVDGCEETCTDREGHRWADIGECYVIEWLNIGDHYDDYSGSTPLNNVSGPIVTEWQGECYSWEYAA